MRTLLCVIGGVLLGGFSVTGWFMWIFKDVYS